MPPASEEMRMKRLPERVSSSQSSIRRESMRLKGWFQNSSMKLAVGLSLQVTVKAAPTTCWEMISTMRRARGLKRQASRHCWRSSSREYWSRSNSEVLREVVPTRNSFSDSEKVLRSAGFARKREERREMNVVCSGMETY